MRTILLASSGCYEADLRELGEGTRSSIVLAAPMDRPALPHAVAHAHSLMGQVEAVIEPLCRGLPPRLAQDLSRLGRIHRYEAGRIVLDDLAGNNCIGIVVSGILKMHVSRPDGRQQIVGLLLPSDIFGRLFARISPVAVEAATDVALCCFDRTAFEALLTAFPALEHRMLLSLSHELDAAQNWILLLSRQTVTEKVASFLLMLGSRSGIGSRGSLVNGQVIEVAITRRDMAACLGTTVESISRLVQQMARDGILRVLDAHHFEILSSQRLQRLSDRA